MHKHQEYICTCLRSIISQYLKNIVIIVINNASKENTIEILNQIEEKYNR